MALSVMDQVALGKTFEGLSGPLQRFAWGQRDQLK